MPFRLSCCAFAGIATLVAGCATTADLYLKNDRVVTGKIVDSDKDNVYVRRQMEDGSVTFVTDRTTTISRREILDVDQPGNGVFFGGLVVTGFGIWAVSETSGRCGAFTLDVPCQLAHVPLMVGIPMALWGLWVWLDSTATYHRARAARPERLR